MDNRLQELTDKIYQEGVAKGNEEASQIVEQAKAEAVKILADAQKEAESITSSAKKSAEEISTNTKSELQLTGSQMMDSVKQEIAGLLNDTISDKSVKPAVSDPAFIKEMLKSALAAWAKGEDVLVLTSEKDEKAIADFIKSGVKGIFDAGITLKTVNNINSGFQIGPVDESYKISFAEDDFVSFFKGYIRPRLAEILFA